MRQEINTTNLSLKDKVDLLKDLVDNLDIVITAFYGAEDILTSDMISITKIDIDNEIKKDETIVISTSICTG